MLSSYLYILVQFSFIFYTCLSFIGNCLFSPLCHYFIRPSSCPTLTPMLQITPISAKMYLKNLLLFFPFSQQGYFDNPHPINCGSLKLPQYNLQFMRLVEISRMQLSWGDFSSIHELFTLFFDQLLCHFLICDI